MKTLLVPKAIAGEVFSEEDKALIAEKGNQITADERAALFAFARVLGMTERAVVVRSFASQDWIKYQCSNWGFVTGGSYNTNDKIIEVQWLASGMKGTYQIDELEVIHKGLEYNDCKDILAKFREFKKEAKQPSPVINNTSGYDLYSGFEE